MRANLSLALSIFALLSFCAEASADCFECRCLKQDTDKRWVVQSKHRVTSARQCSLGCFGVDVSCSINFGVCYPSNIGGAYDLRQMPEAQCQDCGRHWTHWRSLFSRGLNPCPAGCERDEDSIGRKFRSVSIPPRLQEKNKFQCWGTPTPPQPASVAAPAPAPRPLPRPEKPCGRPPRGIPC